MNKQYETPETELLQANEPTEAYPVRQETLHLDISFDGNAVMADIKKAIEMIKGITRVSIQDDAQAEMSGIDKGLEDIAKGNVFHAKDSTDLVNQIFGQICTLLPEQYRAHKLTGRYADCWECHMQPDWLLIWRQNDTELELLLIDTGTHSDLFQWYSIAGTKKSVPDRNA